MTLTLATFSLSSLALLASIAALFVAWSTSDRTLARRCSELSTRCSDLEASHEALTGQLRNLRSRANMQAYRARKNAASSETDEGEPDQGDGREWVAKMNQRLAQARLGLHGGGK